MKDFPDTSNNQLINNFDNCDNCGSRKYFIADSRMRTYGRHRSRKCRKCSNKIGTIEIKEADYKRLIDAEKELKQIVGIIKKNSK